MLRTPLHRSARLLVLLLSFAVANVAAAMEARVIYRCKTERATTFSDTPCGSDAQAYEPDDGRVSGYTPNEVAPTKAKSNGGAAATKKNRQKVTASNDRSTHESQCNQLDAALRDIARKMRSGYTAREGERLKERKAKLEKKRRDKRCR